MLKLTWVWNNLLVIITPKQTCHLHFFQEFLLISSRHDDHSFYAFILLI